jgi:peptidoglycan/LPS O-acetylase OafA/YrhL
MRNKRLDILRCIAVLLVLGRHGMIGGVWFEVGWAGVDLFFVLSGFLISGLLFSEYKRTQRISLRTFFIRRGFKIYPAFWAMLIGSYFISLSYGMPVRLALWLRELLFIQNYMPGIWRHTWSLAVEEHFYIILPLFLFALIRLSRNRRDPFWFIPYAFCIIAPVTLALRYLAVHQSTYRPEEFWRIMFLTHLRIDALFFGVVIGYLYHFRPEFIPTLLSARRNRLAVAGITVLLISCCFAFPVETPFMQSFGLTLVYLGLGGLLVLTLSARDPDKSSSLTRAAWSKIGDALAFVGMYSYSIYLWHIPIATYGLRIVQHLSPVTLSMASLTYIYIAISIPFGILMARIVEFPVLLLRDRLFPRTGGAVIPSRADRISVVKLALSKAVLAQVAARIFQPAQLLDYFLFPRTAYGLYGSASGRML